MARIFEFPNPVNEVAARVVAGGVVVLAGLYLLTSNVVVLALLAAGFLARVAAGPRFSPLGRLAVHVVAPAIGPAKLVPGPPKRFAQGIGATVSTAALILHLAGATGAAAVLIGVLVVAASLEAVLGFCLGCWAFGLLMRTGVIPDSVCVECSNLRLGETTAA